MPRTLDEHLDRTGPKRILSLDGGGVKGILTLGMLESLEAELRRRSGKPNLVLSDYYDLIGGTSTGAIVASGLALGLSVADLTTLYNDLGPKVFKRRRASGLLLQSKYDHRELTRALEPVLGDTLLGDRDKIKTGLSIHMKRIDTGAAWTVSNHPKSPYYDPEVASATIPNRYYRLIDLVRASAAAPTFFEEVKILTMWDRNRRPVKPGWFVDGAVSANNNPSVQLMMTALVPEYGFAWAPGADNLMMTSLGTGQRRPQSKRGGFTFQLAGVKAVDALRAMIYDTQIQNVKIMQTLSDPRLGWPIDSEITNMRGRDRSGARDGEVIRPPPFTGPAVLDFQRVDVDLAMRRPAPDPRKTEQQQEIEEHVFEGGLLGIGRTRFHRSPAEKLLGEWLPTKTLRRLDELANGDEENMRLLNRIGLAAGTLYFGPDYPSPKFDPDWSRV